MNTMLTLKAARINCGYSCKQAAEALGISTTMLYNYESGRSRVTVELGQRLCALYALPPQQILFPRRRLRT